MALDPARIHRTIRKLRKLLQKPFRRPGADDVHEWRTHTRRFEDALEVLDLDSRRNERPLRRALRRLRKRAGKVRDMDVLTSYASDVMVAGERDCRVALLEH